MGSDDPATVTDVKAASADFSWATVPTTTDSDLSPLSSKSFSRNQRFTASEQSVTQVRSAESAVSTATKSWVSSANW